jgi:hypothetical protein
MLAFDPEDGGDTFLQYVGLSPNYVLLQPSGVVTVRITDPKRILVSAVCDNMVCLVN